MAIGPPLSTVSVAALPLTAKQIVLKNANGIHSLDYFLSSDTFENIEFLIEQTFRIFNN